MKKSVLFLTSFLAVISGSTLKAAGATNCDALYALCLWFSGPDPVAWAGCTAYYVLCLIFG